MEQLRIRNGLKALLTGEKGAHKDPYVNPLQKRIAEMYLDPNKTPDNYGAHHLTMVEFRALETVANLLADALQQQAANGIIRNMTPSQSDGRFGFNGETPDEGLRQISDGVVQAVKENLDKKFLESLGSEKRVLNIDRTLSAFTRILSVTGIVSAFQEIASSGQFPTIMDLGGIGLFVILGFWRIPKLIDYMAYRIKSYEALQGLSDRVNAMLYLNSRGTREKLRERGGDK